MIVVSSYDHTVPGGMGVAVGGAVAGGVGVAGGGGGVVCPETLEPDPVTQHEWL